MFNPMIHDAGTRGERLPLDFDQVTPEWLTRLLQLQYPGVVVESIKPIAFTYGNGNAGNKRFKRHIARVEVGLNQAGRDAGIPSGLCLKSNWSGNTRSSPVCVNEARFYRCLASQLSLPTPTCFFVDWDDDARGLQGLIVMEDLVPQGGTFCTSARPISVDEMAKSLEGLAHIHGATWGHLALDQNAWLQTAMAPETVTDDYWSMMPEYVAEFNRLPERIAIFPRLMKDDPNRLRTAFLQQCAHEQAYTGPLCLIHGDTHLGNSYLHHDGRRIWFDWQIARKGRPWRDLAYFLIGSITIADRRKAERDLLKTYLDGLASHGVQISFDTAWAEYRRMVIWGLVAWQANLNASEETMAPLERFCRAADDLETETLFQLD